MIEEILKKENQTDVQKKNIKSERWGMKQKKAFPTYNQYIH